MKRLLVVFLLLTWLILGLIGCQTQAEPTHQPEEVRLDPTATDAVVEVETPVRPSATIASTEIVIPSPTVTPTMETASTGQELPTGLDCGETFCQAPWAGLLARPVQPEGRNTIDLTYPYANTKNGQLDPHHGVEFPNPFGTHVLAAGSGEVVYAGEDSLTVLGPYTGFYGNVLILRHEGLFGGEDVFTLYAHLSSLEVEIGQQVETGDLIGKVGQSGAADGPHLHFEVRLGVNDYAHTLNPMLWFAPFVSVESASNATLAGLILDPYGQPLSDYSLSLEKLDAEGNAVAHYYPLTYTPSAINAHPVLGENFVMPDIPAGDYRLAFVYGGLNEVFFTLEPGALGFISLQTSFTPTEESD